jgi:mono/diheme cytochrome c family protein
LTEIPEHLLKRSRDARGKSAGDAGGTAEPSSAPVPAKAESAAPARAAAAAPVAAPPKPKTVPAPVAAARRRSRVPIWAMPVVVGLPVWGFMYLRAIKAPEPKVTGPLAGGAVVYGKCASCHGSDGAGGVGYAFTNNALWLTFPTIEEQIRYVYQGTKGFKGVGYGNPDRPGGQRIGGAKGAMPNWGAKSGGELTDAELVEVICHERHTLAPPTDPALKAAAEKEAEEWCSADGKHWLEVEEEGLDKMGVDLSKGI